MWHAYRVIEAIFKTIDPNNIKDDSDIKLPEAWTPTVKKHKPGEPYDRRQLKEGLIKKAKIRKNQSLLFKTN